jgi:hypothetical protein
VDSEVTATLPAEPGGIFSAILGCNERHCPVRREIVVEEFWSVVVN